MSDARELKTYAKNLENISTTDNVAFMEAIKTGILLGIASLIDIAHTFSVSRPTVKRWENGTSAPHPLMRPHVFKWLQRRAFRKIRETSPSKPEML